MFVGGRKKTGPKNQKGGKRVKLAAEKSRAVQLKKLGKAFPQVFWTGITREEGITRKKKKGKSGTEEKEGWD